LMPMSTIGGRMFRLFIVNLILAVALKVQAIVPNLAR
jgi:hypothetical protein